MPIAYPDHLTGILSTFDPYILNNSTLFKSGFPARYNSFLSSYINMRPEPGNKHEHEGELTIGLVSSALKAKGPIIKKSHVLCHLCRTSYLQHISRLYNRSMDDKTNPNYMPEYSFSDITATIDSRLSDKWRMTAFGYSPRPHENEDQRTRAIHFRLAHLFRQRECLLHAQCQRAMGFPIWRKNTYSEGDAFGSVPMGGGNRNYALLGQATYSRQFSDKLNLNSGAKFEYSRFETANKSDDSQNLLIKSSDKDFNLYELYLDIAYYLNHYFSINVGGNYQFYSGETREHTFHPGRKSATRSTNSLSGQITPRRFNI